MCIAFISISDNPERDGYKLIIAQNRDEYFGRLTKELDWWDDVTDIISGMDLSPGKVGGTWLGISKTGRVGILTNYRQNPLLKKEDEKGRGHLVSDFLKSQEKPGDYLENIKKNGHEYGGFNLIVGEVPEGKSDMKFNYYCNKEHKPFEDLKPGIYGLSNRYLDYGWKKIIHGKEKFKEIIDGHCSWNETIEKILEMLQDSTRYEVDDVFRGPDDKGIPDKFLEPLTAISVHSPERNYGTRTNSVILVDSADNVTFFERTMAEQIDINNVKWKTSSFQFKLQSKE